jgi:hypothetical protein
MNDNGGACGNWQTEGVHAGFLWVYPEEKGPLGKPRRRWEYNIKMDFQDVGWRAWTGLTWLRIGIGGGRLEK